jgi:hypothetical protein
MNNDEENFNINIFHMKPFSWKWLNPAPHSCARCEFQPIPFAESDVRINPHPTPYWREGVSEEEKKDALRKDKSTCIRVHRDALKIHPRCTVLEWTRVSPFYPNECKKFEDENTEGEV